MHRTARPIVEAVASSVKSVSAEYRQPEGWWTPARVVFDVTFSDHSHALYQMTGIGRMRELGILDDSQNREVSPDEFANLFFTHRLKQV